MPLSNIRLLFVEDDPTAQEQMRRLLEGEVRKIYQAYDGQEGIELYRRHAPDIIISDIRMPVMSGLEMVRFIREEDPDQVILLLSAHDDRQTLFEAINLSVDGFLSKPILDLNKLMEKLRQAAVLAKKRSSSRKAKAYRSQLRTLYLQANTDPLTGLRNRNYFHQQLHNIIEHEAPAVLFFIDVDDLKKINDSYGHAAGDRALKRVASHLKSILPKSATLARIGGDEFAIVLEGEWGDEELARIARDALEGCDGVIVEEGEEPLKIGCSIGISRCPEDGKNPEELLHHADLAMYRVKREGKSGYRFYNPRSD